MQMQNRHQEWDLNGLSNYKEHVALRISQRKGA